MKKIRNLLDRLILNWLSIIPKSIRKARSSEEAGKHTGTPKKQTYFVFAIVALGASDVGDRLHDCSCKLANLSH